MVNESAFGFDFGQSEKLTTRIRGLIHDYPEGLGIVKELLQNADDAGAREVRIVVDWNSHDTARLPGISAAKLQGPALLVFNDREFTPKDLHDIQQIGNSGKAKTAEKTGRFGLGFNSVYNVTDWPGFVTADSVQFFDPHRSAIPGATQEHPGRGYRLSECWSQFPDLIAPFTAGGLTSGASYFSGTVFRLPFRTPEHAGQSEISPNKAFGRDNISAILEELEAIAGEILLFLKHVEILTVSELNTDGSFNELISLMTSNQEEVRASRDSVFPLLTGDTAALIQKLRSDPSLRPSTTYTHRILARFGEAARESSWMVVSGLFLDPEGQVLATADEMIDRGEKAIPLAGAAVRLQTGRSPSKTPFRGRAYCSLPLNVETGLPVHVNGFFDLDSARHTLTLPGAQTGKDRVRGKWNELVATQVIPQAYAKLISALARHFGDRRPRSFYACWPDPSQAQGKLFESLVQSVYRYLAPHPVIRSANATVWVKVTELSLIPSDKLGKAIEAPLVAEKQKVPFPALPQKIVRGFKAASIKVQTLQPTDLRNLLRVSQAIGKLPKEAPRVCLRKKRWIKSLLQFCLSDGKRDLKGLPLVIMADGTIQAFGFGPGGKTFLASKQQRDIFAKYPSWFVDEAFVRSCALDSYPEVGFVAMTASDFVARLKSEFSGEDRTWNPSNPEAPNADWLVTVFGELTSHAKVTRLSRDALETIPLVWFEVDARGLSKLIADRGKSALLYELIQNAWDQDVRRVDVTLVRIRDTGLVELIVTDDDPNGFADLTHTYTLFAESGKKSDPVKRGRFNLGEKLVLALCEEATISSTTGTIRFAQNGRRRSNDRRPCGSEFRARLRMTGKEWIEAGEGVKRLLAPEGIRTTFNGQFIHPRTPIATFDASLPTVVSDDEGILRATTRKTTI